MLDVSIIIVNWNTCDMLRNCLRSIYEQIGTVSFEVIVIDNASKDGSSKMVKDNYAQVILIENLENRGFAAANNQGIEIAKGRYILLLNSDTIVCDAAIEKTINYADLHLNVAVVGCQVLQNEDTVQMTCFCFPNITNIILSTLGLSKLFKYNRFLGREWMLWWQRDSEREVDVVSGMFMLVRRKAIEEIGLLDESYFVYCEETDWCYRFAKAGWKIIFWPGARIIHLDGGGKSINQVAAKMFVQHHKSMLIFVKKNLGKIKYWIARLALAFMFSLRLFVCLILLPCMKLIPANKARFSYSTLLKNWAVFKFCVFGFDKKDTKVMEEA